MYEMRQLTYDVQRYLRVDLPWLAAFDDHIGTRNINTIYLQRDCLKCHEIIMTNDNISTYNFWLSHYRAGDVDLPENKACKAYNLYEARGYVWNNALFLHPNEKGLCESCYNLMPVDIFFVHFYLLDAIQHLCNQPLVGRQLYTARKIMQRLTSHRKNFCEKFALHLRDYLLIASYGEARYGQIKCEAHIANYDSASSRTSTYKDALKYSPEKLIPTLKELFAYEWRQGYGGKAWAKIIDAIELYNVLPHDVFIDHVADITHNGGCAYDKPLMFSMQCSEGNLLRFLSYKREHDILDTIGTSPVKVYPLLPVMLDMLTSLYDVGLIYPRPENGCRDAQFHKHTRWQCIDEALTITEKSQRERVKVLGDRNVKICSSCDDVSDNVCSNCNDCESCCECYHCEHCGVACNDICCNCMSCEDCCSCVYCHGCKENILPKHICDDCEHCTECCTCPVCAECDARVAMVCKTCNYCDDCCQCAHCEKCDENVLTKNVCTECNYCDDCCQCAPIKST